MNPVFTASVVSLVLTACAPPAQDADTTLVISSDPELRRQVESLLPGLAERSGLELRRPVKVERRSRTELERYLRAKLDEEMPADEERWIGRSYALLGLLPEELDLGRLLLDVYTEQVVGFYAPDSTALFVLDDAPPEALEAVLLHELVHAVQDQAVDLDSLTDRSMGNDRQVAAQAAIEGQATLVMLEAATARRAEGPVDLSEISDFAAQVRPTLEAARAQYPALGGAPKIVQESVLFPYVEGTLFVHALWAASDGEARPAPFGERLPRSTEQVLRPEKLLSSPDPPTTVTVDVAGTPVLYRNTLGQAETRILLEEVAGLPSEEGADSLSGPTASEAADGWDGDRYALVGEGDGTGLAWVSVWDDAAARDRFVHSLRPGLDALPREATLEPVDVDGRPAALLLVGEVGPVTASLGPVEGG